MKICIILGTRPEIIKLSPVISELKKQKIESFIIHSNQHYSENMDAIFFKELELDPPKYNLNIGSGGHSKQTGSILIHIEPILEKEKPDWVLVQGDTNTVLAGALAAHKLGIKVAHIEAGLRSFDKTMPEESNRIITDHISTLLFAVSKTQLENLNNEGIESEKVHVVGNTIVDAVKQNVEIAKAKSKILNNLKIKSKEYVLLTCHRSKNVDNAESLSKIISLIAEVNKPVIWPIHLRTQKKIQEFKIQLPSNIVILDPIGFSDFLMLENNAQFIITDSGGVQEEACILGIPCITIRENTERPETIEVGSNVLVGTNKNKFHQAIENLPTKWANPFGAGNSSELIVSSLLKYSKEKARNEKISVVGLGYMGLPMALLLANESYQVNGYDINREKVSLINQGKLPFNEEGLNQLLDSALESSNFKAHTELLPSDVFIVAVPTPHKNSKCDLTYVLQACEDISKVAKDNDLVIIESTIKPGTCRNHVTPIFKNKNLKVDVIHCPERAIPGDTLNELVNNDRIIGGDSPLGLERAKRVYSSFVKGQIFLTDLNTAEAVKLMENTFRDVNIALANEFSILADDLNFNIWEAIQLANRHPRVNILTPGPGVGGHCIAIDPWFLTEDTKNSKLIETARKINDGMPEVVIERLFKKIPHKPGIKIGILGVAYKKNVDDARETPAERIVELLKEKNCEVRVHDPFVTEWHHPIEKDLLSILDWADYSLLVTDHDIYQGYLSHKNILNTRGRS